MAHGALRHRRRNHTQLEQIHCFFLINQNSCAPYFYWVSSKKTTTKAKSIESIIQFHAVRNKLHVRFFHYSSHLLAFQLISFEQMNYRHRSEWASCRRMRDSHTLSLTLQAILCFVFFFFSSFLLQFVSVFVKSVNAINVVICWIMFDSVWWYQESEKKAWAAWRISHWNTPQWAKYIIIKEKNFPKKEFFSTLKCRHVHQNHLRNK